MSKPNFFCSCVACRAAVGIFTGVALVAHANDHHVPIGPVPTKAHIEISTATSTTSIFTQIVALSTSTR